jgi:hypothetical protein
MKKKSILDYCMFFEAWIFLNLSKLMILFFSFKKIAVRIGVPQYETDFKDQSTGAVDEIQIAVMRGSKYVFFASNCYDKALTSTFMLKRRNIPSTIYFGVNMFENKLTAHAWVRCGTLIVSGKKGHQKYTPIAWFGAISKS